MVYVLHQESKLVSSQEVGNKACNLQRLVKAGCNVPEALLIPHVFFNSASYSADIQRLSDELPLAIPSDHGWAVRSSSLHEDGSHSSQAGKYTTRFIRDASELTSAVAVVRSTDETGESMSVIVQKFIAADVSGVVFSENPVAFGSGPVIEIVEGSGEQLVSGYVTPWTYCAGGWVASTPAAPVSQSLTNSIIQTAQRIRDLLQYEVDMEFCILDSTLYWLQVRPITAFSPSSSSTPQQDLAGDWFLLDQCTEPATPLEQQLDPSGLFHSEHWDTRFVCSYPYIQPKFNLSPADHGEPFSIWEEWMRISNQYEPVFDQFIRQDLDHYSVSSLWQLVKERVEVFRECCSAYMSRAWLKERRVIGQQLRAYIKTALGEHTNVEAVLGSLAAGLDTITNRKHLQLHELIELARETEDFHVIAKDFRTYPDHPWVRRFLQFIQQYGYECPHPALIHLPLLKDNPDSLITLILERMGRVPTSTLNSASTDWQSHAARIAAGLADVEKPNFQDCLSRFRESVLRTENDDYLLQKGAASVRVLVVELGRRLAMGRILEQTEHIFYLLPHELELLVSGTELHIRDRIAARRQEHLAARSHIPAQVITDCKTDSLETTEAGVQKELTGQIASHGVAEGLVFLVDNPLDRSGYGSLTPESILVTSVLSPSLTYNIGDVAAIVTEMGGFLSHGAIYARERGIPALVAVEGARKRLRNGDRVVVDANSGRISLIE